MEVVKVGRERSRTASTDKHIAAARRTSDPAESESRHSVKSVMGQMYYVLYRTLDV